LDKESAKLDAKLAQTDAELKSAKDSLAQTDAKLAQTDAKLAQTDAELKSAKDSLAQTDLKLAQTEKELAFIKEANQVQKDFLENLQAYLDTKDQTKLDNLNKIYAHLQQLN
jgi:septal ring factor EnvC (AmiA/AmiB activator)